MTETTYKILEPQESIDARREIFSAIADPTPAMIAAGARAFVEERGQFSPGGALLAAEKIWRAMHAAMMENELR